MFGKPEWFKLKTFGWGIHPVSWQGWGWAAGWLTVMLVPYVSFLSSHMWTEGFIWLGAMLTAMMVDVWQIVSAIKRPLPAVTAVEEKPTTTFRPRAPESTPPAPEKKRTVGDDGITYLSEPVPTGRGIGTKHYDLHVRK